LGARRSRKPDPPDFSLLTQRSGSGPLRVMLVHLDIVGKGDPRMPALLVNRDRRRRNVCVRKGPHRDGDMLFVTFLDVEERRPAFRAEGERESSAFVSHPNELRAVAPDGHGPAREACLRAKDAAGSALARRGDRLIASRYPMHRAASVPHSLRPPNASLDPKRCTSVFCHGVAA
jgi:hypothetical protein